jgi:ribonuclease VapC
VFVDASALVAILLREPGWEPLSERLQTAEAPVTSAIAIYETVLAIARTRVGGIEAARQDVAMALEAAGIEVLTIGPVEADAALDAFARYGKGQGHPAQLNLGDCFAYAVAKTQRVTLLFKGDDFSHTDMASP